MSYSSWHTYGYGICTTDIPQPPISRIQNLLNKAPKFKGILNEYFAKAGIQTPDYEDYEGSDEDYGLGLTTILKKVILEAEGINFTACDDCNSNQYLIYEPSYPWNLPEGEKDLTEESIQKILQKYVKILTDEDIQVDYQSAENGG